jgi:hypothetical protein
MEICVYTLNERSRNLYFMRNNHMRRLIANVNIPGIETPIISSVSSSYEKALISHFRFNSVSLAQDRPTLFSQSSALTL